MKRLIVSCGPVIEVVRMLAPSFSVQGDALSVVTKEEISISSKAANSAVPVSKAVVQNTSNLRVLGGKINRVVQQIFWYVLTLQNQQYRFQQRPVFRH